MATIIDSPINTIEPNKFYRVPVPLVGNAFFFGAVGSGKSWKMLSFAQGYLEKNYTIWDLYGGKRNESPFWCFKSEEKKLWEEFENEVGRIKGGGPKDYNVTLLYPMFIDKLPKHLPELLPRVETKLFTIPIKSIKLEDIALITGELSSNAKHVWNTIIRECKGEDTGPQIEALFETKFKKYKELSIYKLFIKPALDNHLLSSEDSATNLDLIEESKKKDYIKVLCVDYIEDAFKWFFIGYFLRNILSLAMENKIDKRNIAILREASAIMKIQDKNKQGEEQTQILRNQLSDVARYSRSGLHLFMDTQSPRECGGLIEGQDDLTGINEMPSQGDREALCTILLKDRRISKAQVRYIYNIPKHQMIVVARGDKAKLIKRIIPPRNQCWKPTMGDFYSFWKLRFNSYKSTKPEMTLIEDEYSRAKTAIEEKKIKDEEEIELARIKKREIHIKPPVEKSELDEEDDEVEKVEEENAIIDDISEEVSDIPEVIDDDDEDDEDEPVTEKKKTRRQKLLEKYEKDLLEPMRI